MSEVGRQRVRGTRSVVPQATAKWGVPAEPNEVNVDPAGGTSVSFAVSSDGVVCRPVRKPGRPWRLQQRHARCRHVHERLAPERTSPQFRLRERGLSPSQLVADVAIACHRSSAFFSRQRRTAWSSAPAPAAVARAAAEARVRGLRDQARLSLAVERRPPVSIS